MKKLHTADGRPDWKRKKELHARIIEAYKTQGGTIELDATPLAVEISPHYMGDHAETIDYMELYQELNTAAATVNAHMIFDDQPGIYVARLKD